MEMKILSKFFSINITILIHLKIFDFTILNELEPYRLPNSIRPIHYELRIITELDEERSNFSGSVSIAIRILNNTNKIVLHCGNLNISEKYLYVKKVSKKSDFKYLNVINTTLIPKYDFLEITLSEECKARQKYLLYIQFNARLKEQLSGYFLSHYRNRNTNRTEWLTATQFEALYARQAFPCFDEPQLKATFKIFLGHHNTYNSLSNMPLLGTTQMENVKNWVWDEFEKSVPMSTYLVAYSINEFGYKISNTTNGKTKFKIWARKDLLEHLDFALEIGPKLLHFFEVYFNVEFPLLKQDVIALPDMFEDGMENWGLIAVREDSLLCQITCSVVTKQEIALLLAHELAHQWFGNLVTMNWWNDIWLNEGFATYMEIVGVNYLFPEWNVLDIKAVIDMIEISETDSLNSSHEISVPIHDPQEIDQVFDDISYIKGSILVRMIVLLFGEEVFRHSMSHYFKEYSFKSAEQNDLWGALTYSARKAGKLDNYTTISSIMDSWTLQPGFPIITVIRDYKNDSAIIKQERYLLNQLINGTASINEETNHTWMIPLTFTTSSELDFQNITVKQWLNSSEITMKDIAKNDDWVIFNLNMLGLYKVNYDKKNWNKLANTLKNSTDFKLISTLNRVQLINDMMDFAWYGRFDYETAFGVLNYVFHEDEYLPWLAAIMALNKIKFHIKHTSLISDYKRYLRKLIKPIFSKKYMDLSVIPTEYEDYLMKVLITKNACDLGIKKCLSQIPDLFNRWKPNIQYENAQDNSSTLISEELKFIIYCNTVKYGTENEWNLLWEAYNDMNNPENKNTILLSLTCSSDVNIIKKMLNMIIDTNSDLKQHDRSMLFGMITNNFVGYPLAKDFLYNNISEIKEVFKDAPPAMIGELPPYIIQHMIYEKDIKEMAQFLGKHEVLFLPSGMIIKQSFESALVGGSWIKNNYEIIKQIFS